MTASIELPLHELKQRLEKAESALEALRKGQVDTILGQDKTLVVRLAEAEARDAYIKKVLSAVRNCNRLIAHESDPARLIQLACLELNATLNSPAWIALLDNSGTVTGTSSAGFKGAFQDLETRLRQGVFPTCMRQCLGQERPAAVWALAASCTDCPLAGHHADLSIQARRLEMENRIYGVILVYLPAGEGGDTEEQTLFDQLADDLAFGLRKIEDTQALIGERNRLQKALGQVKTLKGLLPICANCKKIRDDQGYWKQVESYIGERSETEFSHGLCPECEQTLYPELQDDKTGGGFYK
ncbi:MAG: GAF domain-containing protein [Desulfohalobiaceae bacterium]|nr:GAF domain-containing protein [Desulfohalobiaceae bacterium]